MPLLPGSRRPTRALATVLVVALLPLAASGLRPVARAGPAGGYWLVGSDGGIFAFGDAPFYGSTGALHLNQPIVGMAPTPTGRGYRLVASDGGIFSFGDATFAGSTGNIRLNKPIVGMTSTPTGRGYWLVASDGGIFSFGDAAFHGSTGAIKLNQPIVGMASTPTGRGYWLVASDGGIFSFGDAAFYGSTGAIKLNRPIVGMASTPTGRGYWLVASDGGIFSFGDAAFYGSTGALRLAQPIAGMATTRGGRGYWLAAADGGVFSFGDAVFHGSAPQRPGGANRKMQAMVPTPSGGGYWQAATSGEVLAFGDAAPLGNPFRVNHPVVGMAAFPTPAPPALGTTAVEDPTTTTTATAVTTTTTTVPAVAGDAAPQFFSSQADPTWGTSPSLVEANKAGRVLALAEAGDKVFLAGEFDGLVPPGGGPPVNRPYLAAIDVNTGALLAWDAHPDGAVLSLAVSPDGRRLYAGGRFRAIGGAPAGRIAALDVDTGLADSSFKPPQADSGVKALALSGSTLFVGGDFTALDDVSRPQLAALDAATGALRTDWIPPENSGGRFVGHTGTPTEDGTDGLVFDLAVTADGSLLLVAGDFLHFGGQSGLLAVDAATGEAASWQPSMTRPVFGVAVWPGDGSTFFVSTGGTGGQVQAFKPGAKSTKPAWVAKVDGDATDVVSTTERVFLVGHYDYVLGKNTVCGQSSCFGGNEGDVPNRHLSVFDARNGAHDLSFTAQANTPQGPYVALVGARHLYVGGDFTEVNGKRQPGFVQFPATG
jgi:hypothetical protein